MSYAPCATPGCQRWRIALTTGLCLYCHQEAARGLTPTPKPRPSGTTSLRIDKRVRPTPGATPAPKWTPVSVASPVPMTDTLRATLHLIADGLTGSRPIAAATQQRYTAIQSRLRRLESRKLIVREGRSWEDIRLTPAGEAMVRRELAAK